MMSYTALAAWSRPVSSPYCTEHGQRHGALLSGRITTVAISRSGQLGRRCIIEPNCSGMSARLAGASVTRERALETCEPSCMPGATRTFFIPVVHSPLGAVGYVVAPELSSRRGRARSHGTRGSTRAHFVRKARFEAEGHMAAPKLTLTRRRGTGPRDTRQHRSPPLHGGMVQSYNVRGSAWMHALLLVLT
jgi:hypothetical protein